MISGGIGITPFISVIRELVYQSSVAETASTPKLLLVCVFRTSAELDMLDLLVPASGGLYGTPSLDLGLVNRSGSSRGRRTHPSPRRWEPTAGSGSAPSCPRRSPRSSCSSPCYSGSTSTRLTETATTCTRGRPERC
ncbi:unnamed protein product [Triticum turgidum subsp. durum]|uniref:Ferric reductase NAD binding domain-containing protein n=1 Tax=Triticum turgidum subsp. durum TaxID=4567 RepID=A0A9R1RQP6_TRITD|nr:unnamed protein product [Triticum turgidum subsp. durum]